MTAEAAERAARARRWERATDWPLIVAGLIFLAAYAIPILRPDLPRGLIEVCRWLTLITWAIFIVDFVVRVFLADRRLRYVLRHWYDALVVLLMMINRRAQTKLRGRVAVYVVGGAALLAFCAALAVLDAERSNPNANIKSFGDASWWAMTTMTTVGYGDRYPVTGLGRLVAIGLMVGGIALLGTVTATLASWLVELVGAEKEQAEELHEIVRRLEAKVDQLAAEREREPDPDTG